MALRGRQGRWGRGVCDDDGLVQTIVVLRVQREIILQRDDVAGDVQQPAPHAVAAIGDVGIGQRVLFVAEARSAKNRFSSLPLPGMI